MLVVAVAVANFDGFLLPRPPDGALLPAGVVTATHFRHRVSLDLLCAAPRWHAIPGHFRRSQFAIVRLRQIFKDASVFLRNSENFLAKRDGTEVTTGITQVHWRRVPLPQGR